MFAKCQTTKFTISGSDKGKPKGGRRGMSEYGAQLIEKQKMRFTYGVSERQFSNYVTKARRQKASNPAHNLYALLESRLDNIVFRLGLASSRAFARQIVSHGHILVNGRRVTIPSYEVKPGDLVAIRKESVAKTMFQTLAENIKDYQPPEWLVFDLATKEGKIKSAPIERPGESNISLTSVLEFYSRV